MDPQPFVRQLLAGRDFAQRDPVARSMANFVYLVGDRAAGECLVVDPAWDVDGIVAAAAALDLRVTGALITHYHPDHVGGPMFGHTVQGIARLLEVNPVPIHVHGKEVEWITYVTGVSKTDLVAHESGDHVPVGGISVECLHTPGHTAGSQCFRCGNALIAGDTLFLQGCGRLDLPGSDPEEMWHTLKTRLATIPGDVVLYPGHDYGDKPSAPLDEVRRTNPALRLPDLDTWRRLRG